VRRVRQAKGMLMVEGDSRLQQRGQLFQEPGGCRGTDSADSSSRREGTPAVSGRAGAQNMGRREVPAAWLIETGWLQQGIHARARGNLIPSHAALINRGAASAAEVLALCRTNLRRSGGAFWNSAGDGAGNDRLLTRNKLPILLQIAHRLAGRKVPIAAGFALRR